MVTIYTHPKNKALLKHELALKDPAVLSEIKVVSNEYMSERVTHYDWYPPPSTKFCEYGPEDEDWMRPILKATGDTRFGHVKERDGGPLFIMHRQDQGHIFGR